MVLTRRPKYAIKKPFWFTALIESEGTVITSNCPDMNPTPSRREFLAVGSTAVITTLAFPWSGFAEQRTVPMKEPSLDELRLTTFASQLNSTFQVVDAPVGRVELKLIEAKGIKVSPHQRADAPDAHNEKFSLIFSGPVEASMAQRIYRFEHAKIGTFEMFIVPVVTENKQQQNYQAIFNRPVPTK